MFNVTKAIIYSNKVIIYEYKNIIEIKKDTIIIDKWIIKGEDLKIMELDSYSMAISGNIKGVLIEK